MNALLRQGPIRPPSLFLTLSDGPRAFAEQASLLAHLPWLYRAPRGDGHPVMIIPGFVGDDAYNKPLCRYLTKLGYHATGWNMGRNIGHGLLDPDVLITRINNLFNREGQPVTLIGHSLGGVYAREIARLWPHEVRQVITLASPFGDHRQRGSHANLLYRLLSPHGGEDDDADWSLAPPVPTTAVYTRSDGILDWRISLQCGGHERTENIEVHGSHTGLTLNPAVWYLLADRLAQAPGEWRPFARASWRGLVYPRPAWQPGERLRND
ncbi:MAG: alpha/beta hydrolase [Porticoccaceae bacterium]|jgi:pimeloyl-ACP methyl ester carboxylesterase|nr:alpha/beta hydrolase [Porticoccaceae bacterium]MEA3301131.1 alpha/beta hydrolase [Pseudomonadota bacterium]HLS98499.1 alpha/beta hydrolase [Porticoccaceae bacterium]